MGESNYTRDLHAWLKRNVGGLILKHNDRITAGIPDTSITVYGHTWWFEMKDLDHAGNLEFKLPKANSPLIQRATMKNLYQHGGGRARYLLFCAVPRHGHVMLIRTPEEVSTLVETSGTLVVSGWSSNIEVYYKALAALLKG